MIVSIDDNQLPVFKLMQIDPQDAIALNRGQNGQLNGDRSYTKDKYILKYDFFDRVYYDIIKMLYNQQFDLGVFYTLKVLDSEIPINTSVYIEPASIVPRFGGKTLEGYELVMIQK